MITREEMIRAFRGVGTFKQDSPPWVECVNMVQEYNAQHTQPTHTELLSEIDDYTTQLDEATGGLHNVYTNGDGLWGLMGTKNFVANRSLEQACEGLRLLVEDE